MLKAIFTPLKARFDQLPRTPFLPSRIVESVVPEESEEVSPEPPEDFARDVRIQAMREGVENIKAAEDVQERLKLLAEVHRVMAEDSVTKDVFRELDGFLLMINVISSLHPRKEVVANGPDLLARMEVTRLALAITSEAMISHPQNKDYFMSHVGFDSLTHAISPFAQERATLDQTFGFLLSLALADFSLCNTFQYLRGVESLDSEFSKLEKRIGAIVFPQAVLALISLLVHIQDTDDILPHCVFKIVERMASFSHRNQASLNEIGLGGILFERLYSPVPPHAISVQTEIVMQKLLKRMLAFGASTRDARVMFNQAVQKDNTLDGRILEVLRSSMRVKWPEHFSLNGKASIELREAGGKGMPAPQGYSFMCWISVENLPKGDPCVLFGIRASQRWQVKLCIRSDGTLEFWTNAVQEPAVLRQSIINKGRWTHVTLVHQPARSQPAMIRLFIDGALTDSLNWSYPKFDVHPLVYNLGDAAPTTTLVWNLASAYLIASPLGEDVPRFVHHLGPRYISNFLDADLTRFLTYSAAASLNMYLFSLLSARNTKDLSPLMKVIKNGFAIHEENFMFVLSPIGFELRTVESGPKMGIVKNSIPGKTEVAEIHGDVVTFRPQCLDVGVWEIGGSAVLLRIIELANNPQDLFQAISIFADTLRTSWQNSEDIERIRGYEIFAGILRTKARLINMATFEILFEFLGLDFHSPDASTIVNTTAYRFIALDFELWSRARKEVQRAHLEHFITLLQVSRYKRFNLKQRIAKFGLLRKFLFALQTDMYQHDDIPFLVDSLRLVASQNFSVDETIKPLVSYLAANLHEPESTNVSPSSLLSKIDRIHAREKAEQVLECLTSILSSPGKLERFAAALPLPRICLLLLGERPSPVVASQVLLVIGLALKQSSTFNRKFELVSGWSILRGTLPGAWDPSVHVVAFDVLLGRVGSNTHHSPRAFGPPKVTCPHLFPAIVSSLDRGLNARGGGQTTPGGRSDSNFGAVDSAMDVLLEELIDLHSSCPSFRELFKSHQTTTQFTELCKSFVRRVTADRDIRKKNLRILEKVTHLILMLALDDLVDTPLKQELLLIVRTVEESSGAQNGKMIDHSLLTSSGIKRHSRHRSTTARRSIQILGDRAYQKSLARIQEWRTTITHTERKRLRKMFQDLQEHHRQAERLTQWRISVVMEPGLWSSSEERKWRLDETEGPYRIRKKLEPEQVKVLSVRINEEDSRDVEDPDSDSQSIVQVEVPPWADTYEFSATGIEDDQELAEEVGEDKHRRVRHELEPGDVIEAVSTATRIIGVDSSPGLLILGKTHLYMLDGLVEGSDGEVIEAKDAPRHLLSIPGTMVELDGIQRAQRWPYDQIVGYSKRTCLFRDVALEIYFRDTRSLLVVFHSKQIRQSIHNRLTAIQSSLGSTDSVTPSFTARTPLLFSKVSAKLFNGFRDEISTAQRRWQAREISNFTYLCIINQTSGRTPSDATQYPVFPWVLKDYTSENLDLDSQDSFRDLGKPMGALSKTREEAAIARYTGLQAIEEKPFHYGTHFSSSMITCHFLIRLEPFAHMFKRLQGGDWDLPDRLFTDIRQAYNSASEDSRGDVRELIPEFYTCPEFLVNSSGIDFGVQNSGEKIHDVKLPPWAKQDPLLFIVQHRRALESNYVSEHLPEWIDLIWGYKQRDPEAFNVFHPLSYEGSVDLDSISDKVEREATVGIIHNFGQTPRKIFSTPHPSRMLHGIPTLPLGTLHGIEEDNRLLVQSAKPVRDIKVPVSALTIDSYSDRIMPCRENTLYVPSHPHERIAWGFLDHSLRLYSDRKVIQHYEASFCSCAVFPDSETLVTGSHDTKVRLWRLTHREQASLTLSYILSGHCARVLCVAASRAWSLVVSGSEDGCAMLWELNRAQYVRTIDHGSPVYLAAVNESTGYIATCSRDKLCLHTINAYHIATLDIYGGPPDQRILSLAFHEREWSNLGVLATGTAGGSIALRTWNTNGTSLGERAQWKFETLRNLKCRGGGGVTALRFVGECLFFGQENGKVFSWDLPE